MVTVEGLPSVDCLSAGTARLMLPCSKGGEARLRDFALTREQLCALVAIGIDALDQMDAKAAATASNVIPVRFQRETA